MRGTIRRSGVDMENPGPLFVEKLPSLAGSVARGLNTLQHRQENIDKTVAARETTIARVEAANLGGDEISLSVEEAASASNDIAHRMEEISFALGASSASLSLGPDAAWIVWPDSSSCRWFPSRSGALQASGVRFLPVRPEACPGRSPQ